MTDKKKKLKETAGVSYTLMTWIGSTSSLVAHTIIFAFAFSLPFLGVSLDKVLLVVTTLVSLEAIYMAIFIQMAVNRNTESLEEVEEDIDEIQEDVGEIQKDVDDIQEDVDEIEKDVDEIQKDVDDIQEDVDEIEKDDTHLLHDSNTQAVLSNIEQQLQNLIKEIEVIKKEKK